MIYAQAKFDRFACFVLAPQAQGSAMQFVITGINHRSHSFQSVNSGENKTL